MKANFVVLAVLLGAHGALGQLNVLAKLAGKKYFGSAVDNPALADLPYKRKLSDIAEFGQITASNTLKWETVEAVRGVYNFTGGDELVALAKKNHQLFRGHTCVWHSQLAPWVEAGNFGAKELTSIIEDHCSKIVGHYKGDIWDIVNEAFEDDGTFRKTVFYNTLGTEYFEIALRVAHKADPKTKLYINDYNVEGLNAKSDGYYNLIKALKAKKVPIDGLGVQGHLIVGRVPTTIRENFQRFADLGVDIAVTELDIRMELPVTPEKLEQQKKDYATVIRACKAVRRCVGVTIWDYTDKYSWIPGWFEGEGAALPWDEFTRAPLVSLLFGASYLVASAAAYSYNDYNELDARYQIDDVLSERGFDLEARETVDVPFQPSLRAFLEEAVTAHRRSMSEDQEDLEARALVAVTAKIFREGPPGSTPDGTITMQVNRHAVTVELFKQAIARYGIDLTSYTASVPAKGYKICYGEQMLDKCLEGRPNEGGVIAFSRMLPRLN
ncbi:hypothetical protein D9611_012968 [Ephemerocybe angulata]|uniref:Beta-xylanase n=1 Tax=Ephemerocybe angulata TaxID=980116 RepID=A0A8H5C484_9AGAR|nr:hypothetical protein D9611_012968 [Tulosesus angulatus]